jgi:predicted nucleic acid-binding protein
VTILVDTGPLITLADRRDPLYSTVRALLRAAGEVLLLPAPVTAEADYLLCRRFGAGANRLFLQDLASGVYQVECLDAGDYEAIIDFDRRYSDLHLGLADLSLVAIARRFDTTRIVTFDQRHFRAIVPMQGGAFTLLPFDDQRA